MFGMGFTEIFLILLVAIVALGPEKLPGAAIDIVKLFKKFKTGIEDAKTTLNDQLSISEIKKEAEKLKVNVDDVANLTSLDIKPIKLDNKKRKKKEKISLKNKEA
ncbi:Twin-arginine translocation protein TatB [hydrothermal vent metagenome]|uniref:Twin-arginine translocation protein TatB n=1 Tax=hydrothermal vent metagenome TaxID=652676 RepID=A0A3B1E5K2_9ZZZZ